MSLSAFCSLRMEHVVRSDRASSLGKPKSCRYLATLSEVVCPPEMVFCSCSGEGSGSDSGSERSKGIGLELGRLG